VDERSHLAAVIGGSVLSDRDERVRLAAIRVLRNLGPEAREYLVRAAQDTSETVRMAATEALQDKR